MRLPPLKSIIAFESVARTKSVNRAADELGLTPSAVSHQLANLEGIVGRPLFTRLGRGLVLTPTGTQYLADVTGALAELNRATERASSETSVEILRIHSSPSFGLMWLLPRLAAFQEVNGDIQMNLACSYEDVSFTSGFYDVDCSGHGRFLLAEQRQRGARIGRRHATAHTGRRNGRRGRRHAYARPRLFGRHATGDTRRTWRCIASAGRADQFFIR